jgi:cytochrome bd-type quinol oxidase subunit 2
MVVDGMFSLCNLNIQALKSARVLLVTMLVYIYFCLLNVAQKKKSIRTEEFRASFIRLSVLSAMPFGRKIFFLLLPNKEVDKETCSFRLTFVVLCSFAIGILLIRQERERDMLV